MSMTRFTGIISAFVFILFGFTILYDAVAGYQQVASPIVGLLFLVIGFLAYWLTRKR